MATPLFTTPPVIMFIGSDADVADECARANPVIPVIRVGHAAAAVERMLVTRPLVVVVDGSVPADDVARIAECAQDIRAGLVRAGLAQRDALATTVREAIVSATRLRA